MVNCAQLRSCIALNIGGCTRAYADGVRRLWGGLPPHVFISGNPPHPETSRMQPPSDQHATARGSGGKISFIFPPGGFRFLSPRRKEQRDSIIRHGEVHKSILILSVTRFLPHPLRGSYPQPQSARLPLTGCRLFRLTRSSRFKVQVNYRLL